VKGPQPISPWCAPRPLLALALLAGAALALGCSEVEEAGREPDRDGRPESRAATPPPAARRADRPTTFVALGHLRDIYDDYVDILPILAERINAEEPDYVFLLGDMTLHGSADQFDTFEGEFLQKLRSPYYIAPGNHDLGTGADGYPERLERYIERFGYDHRLLRDLNADFVLVNSYGPTSAYEAALLPMLEEVEAGERGVPTVYLSHHKPWRLKGEGGGLDSWNRTEPEQVLGLLKGRIDYIIAGDANHFFQRGMREHIPSFSVGMWFSGTRAPIYYARGEVDDRGKLEMKPVIVELPKDHPWYHRALYRHR
jgi:hypothetical protein